MEVFEDATYKNDDEQFFDTQVGIRLNRPNMFSMSWENADI